MRVLQVSRPVFPQYVYAVQKFYTRSVQPMRSSSMHPRSLFPAVLLLASFWALFAAKPVAAAGVVTDCTKYGPGSGTLAEATANGGLVTFACSGTIVLPAEIRLFNIPGQALVVDGTGQAVVLSGGGTNRLFNLGPDSSLLLQRVTLRDGNAGQDGGGAIQTAGYLTITNSALLSNTADFGGAVEVYNGRVLVENSTIANNRATGTDAIASGGGAIDQYLSLPEPAPASMPVVEIVNSTIAANSAAVAGRDGLWQENGLLLVKHSVLAGNGSGNCAITAPSPDAQFFDDGSLATDGTCRNMAQGNPMLDPLGDYGGPTPTFALQPGSPAIDAAAPEVCAGSVDQRSLLRPRDGNRDGTLACDLGAYEYADRFMALAGPVPGLAGYWRFDEGGGSSTMDSSGHGLTGQLQAGAVFTSGHPALLFSTPFALQSGAAAGVQVADAPLLNPAGNLSLAAWVRLNRGNGVQSIAAKLANTEAGPGYGLLMRDGVLSGEVWDSGSVRRVVTSTVPSGGWLHVALTYDRSSSLRLYVNGQIVSSRAVNKPLSTSAAPLVMAVEGALDDVRIYSRTLSAGEVMVLAGGRGCLTTGTTWGDSATELQCVLTDAGPGAEVWIGPGVYRPTYGPDRSATFAVAGGVEVYGGFAGGETSRDQRQPGTPRPVLSGDILADDQVGAGGVLTTPAGLVGSNAFHVVRVNSALTTTVLERVTISAGQANGVPGALCGDACGGGLTAAGGAILLKDLQFIGNTAGGRGGAIYAEQSSTVLISATLAANRAGSGGGGFWQGGAPMLVNTLVGGNAAGGEGGGIYGQNSAMRLVNVTLGGNRAGTRAGGLLLDGGGSTGINVVVGANAAPQSPQVAGSSVVLQSSLVEGGCPATYTCAADVLPAAPLFAAADPSNAPGSTGNYRLTPFSPALDRGDNSASLAPIAPGVTIAGIGGDLQGAPRVVAARFPPPRVDMGAYESSPFQYLFVPYVHR